MGRRKSSDQIGGTQQRSSIFLTSMTASETDRHRQKVTEVILTGVFPRSPLFFHNMQYCTALPCAGSLWAAVPVPGTEQSWPCCGGGAAAALLLLGGLEDAMN